MKGATDAQRKQWEDQGYLTLENAVVGDELRRLQAAFDHWAEKCKPEWLDRVEAADTAATYYDIPNPLEKDEVFVSLVDHPSWFGLLLDFMDNDPIFLGPQARTVPPWPVSYTRWHPDVALTNPLHIKVQLYVNDVEEGAFGFIPGSHKLGAGPFLYVHDNHHIPGHKVLKGKAGTAIMFNTYGMHAAMENHTPTPRKSIILIYEKRTPNRVSPTTFASIKHLCTTPERRRLLGLEEPCHA